MLELSSGGTTINSKWFLSDYAKYVIVRMGAVRKKDKKNK